MSAAVPPTVTNASNAASLVYAAPELALAFGALLVVAWDLWAPGIASAALGKSFVARKTAGGDARLRRGGAVAIALTALSVSALGSAAGLVSASPRLSLPALLFDGQLACDGYACAFRVFFAIVTAFVVVAAIPTREAQFGGRRARTEPGRPTVGPRSGAAAPMGPASLRGISALTGPGSRASVETRATPERAAAPRAVEEGDGSEAGGEFLALLLVVCLGMNLMAMGRTLLLVYMAIEIVSVASFVLAGLRRAKRGDAAGPGSANASARRSSEAALKYVVFGGVSSGVMLYGMSWLYGLSQSMVLPEIATRIATLTHEQGHLPNAVAIAAACVTAGFAYKIAAVPFHMWAPDVYEGSATLVAAFLSVGPKAAGFSVLIRFFREGLGAQGALPEAQAPWPIYVGAIAVATMTVGNLSALGQTNLKRLLAYSSIAHAGTMLLAFSAPGEEGIAAIGFYLVTYCVMNLGAFLVVLAVSESIDSKGESAGVLPARPPSGSETIEGIRGLGARAPGMAAALAVFLFSLVGLPPFAGFVGKLYVFVALLRGGAEYRSFYFALAAAAVVNTVISLFYYARILRAMYLVPAPEGKGGPVSVNRLHAVMTALLVAPTVFLGVWWGPLYDFVTRTVTLIP